MTLDGTAEPVSPDQIFRRERRQGKKHFPRSAGHEHDWQPYPVDPYTAICDDHTYIHASSPDKVGQNYGIYLKSYLDLARAPLFMESCALLLRSLSLFP